MFHYNMPKSATILLLDLVTKENTPSCSLENEFLYPSEIIGRKFRIFGTFLEISLKNLRSVTLIA